jgi:hypothetical protein
MANNHRRNSVIVGGLLLLALTACSDGSKSPDVASLGAQGGTATKAAQGGANADDGRPRLRFDMSAEEKKRLYGAYTACLDQHDPKGTGTGPGPAGGKLYNDEAQKACASKYPLPPWEMDSSNPEFKDNWHKNVKCLNRKGLKVVETEPGSWTFSGQSALSSAEQAKVEKDCEQEVFGGALP